MALSLPQTLIRTTKAAAASSSSSSSSSSSHFFLSRTLYSTHSNNHSQLPDVAEAAAAEALAVSRIEDAIHRIIVKRSAPDWLPFLPGASYWVPPKFRNYGIAQLVNKLSNPLSDDEVLSLTTSRGWPSSAFYFQRGDASSDRTEAVEISSRASLSEDEEG